MKIGQKGMSTGAIVGIVVAVVAVVVVIGIAAVLLLGGGVSATGIGAMPGSTKCNDIGGSSATSLLSTTSAMSGGTAVSEASLAGISIDIYNTTSSATEVVNWYKNKWSNEGYTENYYGTIDFSQIPGASQMGISGSMGIALYEKGDEMVGVIAITYQNETYYILVKASKSALEALVDAYSGESPGGGGNGGAQIPTSDVTGSDLSDVPRYPGSVRTYYAQSYGVTTIMYLASESVSTVDAWYETQLTTYGWTSEYTGLWFKGSNYVSVTAEESSTYNGYTAITVVYY